MEPVDEARVFSNRYELTHLIARGGMAQVYRAHDLLLDRVVALKILFPELSVDPTFVERFRREAQAAGKLSHPNIVPVFDWGEDAGTYFIVMEFIDGDPLSTTIRDQGTIAPTRAAVIAASVAGALSYAHRHGVVHRDVKPGNVLLTNDGQVKVTDFGIARAINTEEGLTQVGSVMGTATYFSPEQAEGAVVGARSDVYSLGIVLYEMLVGRPPFQGDSPVAVASKHVRDVAPLPRTFVADLPVGIEAVTMMAIAKAPDDRYASAEDMRADLVRFIDGEPVLADDPEVAAAHAVNATTTMGAISNTQAVPIFPGPRTDLAHRKRRDTRRIWIIALVALLIAALAAGAAVIASQKKAGPLVVPNVVGMSLAKATSTLSGDGLAIGTVTTVASDKPKGTVLSTNPNVGLPVAKGTKVNVTVSDGSGAVRVQVPNVVGKQLPDAEAMLVFLGFQFSVQTSNVAATSANPANSVLSQTPTAGQSEPRGTSVALTVVATPTSVIVPTLLGQQASQAGAILGQANLNLGAQTTACSNSYGTGIITSSNPPSGSSAPPSSSVDIVVSSGFCTSVPGFGATTTYAEYQIALNDSHLVPSSSCLPVYLVTATNPPPGTQLSYGNSVQVTCTPPVTSTTASSGGGSGGFHY